MPAKRDPFEHRPPRGGRHRRPIVVGEDELPQRRPPSPIFRRRGGVDLRLDCEPGPAALARFEEPRCRCGGEHPPMGERRSGGRIEFCGGRPGRDRLPRLMDLTIDLAPRSDPWGRIDHEHSRSEVIGVGSLAKWRLADIHRRTNGGSGGSNDLCPRGRGQRAVAGAAPHRDHRFAGASIDDRELQRHQAFKTPGHQLSQAEPAFYLDGELLIAVAEQLARLGHQLGRSDRCQSQERHDSEGEPREAAESGENRGA